MTTELAATRSPRGRRGRARSSASRVATAAGRSRFGPAYVCAACFGPLDVAYDLEAHRRDPDARGDRGPAAGHLALPRAARRSTRRPLAGSGVGSTPLVDADRLGRGARRRSAVGQGRHPQPVAVVQGSRGGDRRGAGGRRFGIDTLACASTGNLAGATAAAAAAVGMPAYVFIPADLEPAKVEHALAYGATVVPIDGTYDDVNRLCLQVADETGWGFVNVNLRPFYAEGSKTLAFEIAEGLGWRTPDVIVAPIASGAMYTKLARGLRPAGRGRPHRVAPDPIRRRAGGWLRAGRHRLGGGDDRGRAGPHAGHDRPVARDREPGRRPLRRRARGRARTGRSRPIPDDATALAIRRLAASRASSPRAPAA